MLALLHDKRRCVRRILQAFVPNEVVWLMRMARCPGDPFYNLVRKLQNRKFINVSLRNSLCYSTSVVKPNNLTKISDYLQLRKLSITQTASGILCVLDRGRQNNVLHDK